MIIVKFPTKIDFEDVAFDAWNGYVTRSFTEKDQTVLEIKINSPDVLLEITYDKERFKAKDFSQCE